MTSKTFVFIAIQAVLLQAVFGSCVNRLPFGLSEAMLPNQVFLSQPSPCNQVVVPQPCNQVVVPQPCNQLPQISTVVQDSTVANNLANALQLLIVSNLLSNTLPVPEYAQVEVIQNLPYGYNAADVVNGLGLSGLSAPLVSSCGCGAPLLSNCGCNSPLVSGCGCGASLVSNCGCNDIYSFAPVVAPGYSYIY